MEIKTPYRIPYVSQMAALDGVSYKHQPSLELFTCFLLDLFSPSKNTASLHGDCPLKINIH